MGRAPALAAWAREVERADADISLAGAALALARLEYADLDVSRYVSRLDAMAETVTVVSEGRDEVGKLHRLREHLFSELRFRGNRDQYFDPRNSFLNDVLDRRVGIPITLSTVFMEVGRRAGLTMEGVGLPGHFVVRVGGPSGGQLVDPFHRAALLETADCQQRLDRIFGGSVHVDDTMLQATPTKGILARMLRNLKAIYTRQEDHLRALRTVEMLIDVQPEAAEELRDRGMLYVALDCYTLAARDLAAYLERVPRTPEAGRILHTIGEMRRLQARLN
jgi:regulator of sirC expression with transglutaminase-like and TPR domain